MGARRHAVSTVAAQRPFDSAGQQLGRCISALRTRARRFITHTSKPVSRSRLVIFSRPLLRRDGASGCSQNAPKACTRANGQALVAPGACQANARQPARGRPYWSSRARKSPVRSKKCFKLACGFSGLQPRLCWNVLFLAEGNLLDVHHCLQL